MAEEIIVLDEGKMEQKIQDFPNQLEKSWTSLWTKDIKEPDQPIKRILICGMGGSGIVGKLAKELFADQKISIDTWADYGLPAWVDSSTLIVGISYSGETEETVDAIKTAAKKKLPIYTISKGGKIKEQSEINGFPCFNVDFEGAPRAAIGWLYGSLITLLTKLKLVNFTEQTYFQALAELKDAVSKNSFPEKAESLAITLNNKVPVIIASAPITAVANRWVTQLNENSKTFALSALVPELSHNMVVGLDYSIPEKITVIVLESKYEFSRNTARKKIIDKIFTKKDIPSTPLSVASKSLLAEQFLLIHFGDWLSFYLAGVYGVDPTPVESIKFLKEELKKV